MFGPHCYYKSTEMKNWTASREECQMKSSDLVVIRSKEEQVSVFISLSIP